MSATRERGVRLADAWSRITRELGARRPTAWTPHAPVGRAGPAATRARQGLHRGVAASRRSGRRHPKAALAALLAGLVMILGCVWLWFRDSSFVSVTQVKIVGLSGPQVPRIEGALRDAALTMTTLDVNMTQLRTAVAPYRDVRTLTVQTQFPHGLVIQVGEQVPIARVNVNGRTLAISGDGTLLPPRAGDTHLPLLPIGPMSGGSTVNQAGPRAALTVLAAAPYGLLSHIQSALRSSQSGVVVQLRRGPQLRFGTPTQLHDKWAVALAVLGNASSQGAQYIDVSDPGRPAAGASTGASTTASTSASASTGSTGTTTTTPAGAASTAGTAASTTGPTPVYSPTTTATTPPAAG